MSDSPPGVGHTDSINSNDGTTKQTEKKKSRRPANTAFRQQRLKAWQPILTPKTVLPLFFAIGVIFAPIGGLLLYASSQVQEIRIDYTNCDTQATNEFQQMPADNVQSHFKTNNATAPALWRREFVNVTYGQDVLVPTTQCQIQFYIPEELKPPVLFYYQLSNFYQNHRRYVNSFFDKQLKGQAMDAGAVSSSSCTPLTLDPQGRPYYPCGLIANSLFNDSFTSPVLLNVPVGSGEQSSNAPNETYVMLNNSNIAWASDMELYGKTEYSNLSAIAPPPNWALRYPKGYTEDNPPPDLSKDQAFMVWMRTAGLPTFSKLAQRNDNDVMKVGQYQVNINSNFPTEVYRGQKAIVISTRTVMGGRNPFLGIAYIVVGGICIVLGAVFTATHLIKPRKLGDHTYLSWNNAPGPSKGPSGPTTGMATGRDMA